MQSVILSQLYDGILLSDSQGKLLFVNQRMTDFLGYSVNEIYKIGNIIQLLGDEALSWLNSTVTQEIIDKDGCSRQLVIRVQSVRIGEGTRLYNCREINHSVEIPRQSALENGRNVMLQQLLHQKKLIMRFHQRIHNSFNLIEILQATVEEVREFLKVDRVAIYKFTRGHSASFIAESVDPSCKSILNIPLQDPCFEEDYAEKYRQGNVSIIDDIEKAGLSECYLQLLRKMDVQAMLLIPIIVEQQLEGLLCAHQCISSRYWQLSEIDLLQQLAIQLGFAIRQSQLYHQLALANHQLQQLVMVDGLTQLSNRRHFDEYLQTEWQRHLREQVPISLILTDLDYFKLFNDTYGHLAGDDCLRHVAKFFQSTLKRPTDLAARFGGEEFAVILPHTHYRGAVRIAQTLCQGVKALSIPHAKSLVCDRVTLSLGVATTIPHSEGNPSHLVYCADKALYRAKSKGRDQVSF